MPKTKRISVKTAFKRYMNIKFKESLRLISLLKDIELNLKDYTEEDCIAAYNEMEHAPDTEELIGLGVYFDELERTSEASN